MKKQQFILNGNIKSIVRSDYLTILSKYITPTHNGRVCVTGHGKDTLVEILQEKNITLEQFKKELETTILKNFNKEKYYFRLGGYYGFDNIVGEILVKNGYFYDLIVPERDEFGSYMMSEEDLKQYNLVKENAVRVNVLLGGSYKDRNDVLADEVQNLLSFKKGNGGGTEYTFNIFTYKNCLSWKQIPQIKTEIKDLKFFVLNDENRSQIKTKEIRPRIEEEWN